MAENREPGWLVNALPTAIVLSQEVKDCGLQAIAGIEVEAQSLVRVDNDSKEGFQDSPEGIQDMQDHFLLMMNPERYQTTAPIEQEAKAEAIKQAEAFLVADGFKLISEGKIVGLFPGGV